MLCLKIPDTEPNQNELNIQNKTFSKQFFLTICSIIRWKNDQFQFDSKYDYHLFHFIPVPGSWLMFNVSVLIASTTYNGHPYIRKPVKAMKERDRACMNAFEITLHYNHLLHRFQT